MRDLAKQSFSNSAQSSKVQFSQSQVRILIAFVVVLVAILGIKYLISGSGGIGGSAVSVKDATGGLTPVSVSNSNTTAGGINLTSQTASMAPAKSGISGNASATRTFGDGSYSLSVSATLPDPHANSYAVFLSGADGTMVFTDFMNGSGTSWSLSFNDKDKYSKLNKIYITQKITKELKTPETYILEGSF